MSVEILRGDRVIDVAEYGDRTWVVFNSFGGYMITRNPWRWIIALALLILMSDARLLPHSSAAASSRSELFRRVSSNSAVLVFINRNDHKLCLRLTNAKGLASLSPVGNSQAGAKLLKFVKGVWGESRDGRNVREFNIRGASKLSSSNQKNGRQPIPVVFKLAGYPNSEWILTVMPVKRLAKPASGSGDGLDRTSISVVANGGSCGRGAEGAACDPFDFCDLQDNVEFIPGTTFGSHPATATAIYEAEGDTIYTICIL